MRINSLYNSPRSRTFFATDSLHNGHNRVSIIDNAGDLFADAREWVPPTNPLENGAKRKRKREREKFYRLSASRGPFLRAYLRDHLFIITVAALSAEITRVLCDTSYSTKETRV